MALSEIDRVLLERCLARKPRAWEDFVDRYLGLVIHVVRHTSRVRNIELSPADQEDLAAEVFLGIVSNDLAVLRNFRGQSSLSTYLTVVARRIVVRQLIQQKLLDGPQVGPSQETTDPSPLPEERISDQDEVRRLLETLDGPEAEVVKLYHLEGKSYQEISAQLSMAENSVGPTLSRARQKMRQSAQT